LKKFNVVDFLAGIRTASSLLIGNSILIYTGVVGKEIKDPTGLAIELFLSSVAVLFVTSFNKETKK
jgi:hypothetical protein